MKPGILPIFVFIISVINNANGNVTSTIRDVLKSHVHGLVLYIQLGIFGNCNPNNFETSVFQEANGINQIADAYDPILKEFETESVKNAENYPNFVCDLYYYTHECMRDFIPFMSLCQDAETIITSYKMYDAVKHIIDYECANNATVYQVMHKYRHDRCFIGMTRGIDEKLLEVIKIKEEKLFSTEASCRILDDLRKNAEANEINLCNETIKQTVTNGLKQFLNSFQCDKNL